MKLCSTLKTSPSPKVTRLLLLASIVLMLVAYAFMGYYFAASGDVVPIMTSQLSFNDAYLKWQYSLMIAAGPENLGYYRIAQSFDYLYMLSYGLLSFSLALIIGRKFPHDSPWWKMGCLIAVLGPIAAGCDGIENAFILLTLTDPAGFPASWAIAHSAFAATKWILLAVAVGWAFVATLFYLFGVRRRK